MSPSGPPGTADAPFVNAKDSPAAPNIGRALPRRFCFESRLTCVMAESFPLPSGKSLLLYSNATSSGAFQKLLFQRDKQRCVPKTAKTASFNSNPSCSTIRCQPSTEALDVPVPARVTSKSLSLLCGRYTRTSHGLNGRVSAKCAL